MRGRDVRSSPIKEALKVFTTVNLSIAIIHSKTYAIATLFLPCGEIDARLAGLGSCLLGCVDGDVLKWGIIMKLSRYSTEE
jgi:hypothetical protein